MALLIIIIIIELIGVVIMLNSTARIAKIVRTIPLIAG
jgi:hypothetical protein